ncbi:glycosyltransferase family 9 protein [Klebsiella pneumoniae]|uniref:glycosyltransferase family 9 protein n=1 Tax=Klebsiella pneumoniae TaxID=573 RepID=UPI0031BB4C7C
MSPYGVNKKKPVGDLAPLAYKTVYNNALNKVKVDYKKIKKVTIINGLGVTLGDSIIGISALHAIKSINPDIHITLIRPEHCQDYVEQIYHMASGIIDKLLYLPFDISKINHTDVNIDMGNQLYWEDFDSIEMHDFFLTNLGINPKSINDNIKNNSWLLNTDVPDFDLGEYILFCPNASTKIRSIPSRFHVEIVEELSHEFGIKVLGFNDVDHPNFFNISNISSDTLSFAGIIKHACFLYTCDSSALHLGAGFNIPTRCIFTTVKPELRSLYYTKCESIYIGNNHTAGVHCSEDDYMLEVLNKEFEEFYA